MNITPTVSPHPAGGFTLAWPLLGTARIYTGHFHSRRAAKTAAVSAARGPVPALLSMARDAQISAQDAARYHPTAA